MSDNALPPLTLQGLTMMGGSNLRVTGDRATNTVTSVEQMPVAPPETGYSGDVDRPSMVPAMTAETATEQHLLLDSKIAEIDAQLNAQNFDPSTGRVIGFKAAEGSKARELLQIQRQGLDNALQYLAHRALQQLPKRAEARGAADDALIDGHAREKQISALADTRGADGRQIGRVAATRLIDEASAKVKAEALVRGR